MISTFDIKGEIVNLDASYVLSVAVASDVKKSRYNVAAGAPSGARTLDPNIKSVVLYQLS